MFFGREDTIDQLNALLRKRVASLVTCRGRRRIGKSTLIEVFAERAGCRFIKLEGRCPERGMTNADEIAAFASQLADQTSAEATPPEKWSDAPVLARRALPAGPRARGGRRGNIIQDAASRREAICKTKRNPPLGEGLVLHVHNCSFDLSSHALAEVNVPNPCVYLFKPQKYLTS